MMEKKETEEKKEQRKNTIRKKERPAKLTAMVFVCEARSSPTTTHPIFG